MDIGSEKEARASLKRAFHLDRQGREAAAIPLYQKALRGRLGKIDRRDGYVCLASSYRNVGSERMALRTIKRAAALFPNDPLVLLFFALIEFSAGRKGAAVHCLASHILAHPRSSKKVGGFTPVLSRYFQKLRNIEYRERYFLAGLLIHHARPWAGASPGRIRSPVSRAFGTRLSPLP